ncbi:MAG: alpha/beta hydrolase [Myxococcota bacterium]
MTDRAVPEGHLTTVGEEDGAELILHWHDEGEGHPVMMLHGSGAGASGWSNFRHNAAVLAQRGLRAIMPDMPGYGYSSKPPGRKTYPVSYMAESLMALADALGLETFALVGNSMGGAVALTMALDYPDRIDRLVLMAPGGLSSREEYMALSGIKASVAASYSPEGLTREGIRSIFELQLYDTTLITETVLEERWQIAQLQLKRMIGRVRVAPLAERLSEVAQPTLAFWGQNDNFCPPSGAQVLLEQLAGVRLVQLDRCGHWVMVEHAALFNQMTGDFLTGVYDNG